MVLFHNGGMVGAEGVGNESLRGRADIFKTSSSS